LRAPTLVLLAVMCCAGAACGGSEVDGHEHWHVSRVATNRLATLAIRLASPAMHFTYRRR